MADVPEITYALTDLRVLLLAFEKKLNIAVILISLFIIYLYIYLLSVYTCIYLSIHLFESDYIFTAHSTHSDQS